MKKLIFRKFIKDTISFFLLTSLSLALIVWVIQAVNYLDFVTEDGHGFKIYFLYTLLQMPKIIARILMITFFISLFYMIIKYEENNELLIFWTNGIKKIEFANVIIRFSLILLIFQILLNIYIVPKSSDLARSYIRSSKIDFFPALIKEKKFIDTVSHLTIFVNKKNAEGDFENIFLKDQSTGGSQVIFAKKGIITNKNDVNILSLYNGNIIKNDGREITSFTFDKFEFDLSKYSTKTTTYPKFQELETSTLIYCLANLVFNKNISLEGKKIHCIKGNQRALNNVKQELFKRIFLPIYIPLITLLACLLIITNKDSFKYSHFKFLLFAVAIFVIIISEMSVRYVGKSDSSSNFLFALPIIIFVFAYSFLIKNIRLKK